MAHGTKINATSYGIIGGKCLVGGTVYSIKNGKTLINGTVYDISFGKPITVTTDISSTIKASVLVNGYELSKFQTINAKTGDLLQIKNSGYTTFMLSDRRTYASESLNPGETYKTELTGNTLVSSESSGVIYIYEV